MLGEQIVAHVTGFSLASLVSSIGSFSNSYVGALLLGPATWGLWQAARLVLQYGANLHLGVQNGMHREIPILRGKGEIHRQSHIANATFTFTILVAALTGVAIGVGSIAIPMAHEFRLYLQCIALLTFLQYVYTFFGYLLRAHNDFSAASRVALVIAVGSVATIALIPVFGLRGFLMGQVVRLLAATLYAWKKSDHSIHWEWDAQVIKVLLRIGFPIMLMTLAYLLFSSVDRMLIIRFLNPEQLAFYSLGNLVFAPLLVVFTAGNSVMYPRFAEHFGQTGDPRQLLRYVTVPMEILSMGLSVAVGVIYVAIPFAVTAFLPEYVRGITSARILLCGLFFWAVAGMANNLLLTINKQTVRLWILLVSVVLNLVWSYAALKLGFGIVGVAGGTSLSYFFYYILSSIIALRYARSPISEILYCVGKVLAPAAYVTGALWLTTEVIGPAVVVSEKAIGGIAFREIVFVLLTGYLSYVTVKRLGVLGMLRRRYSREDPGNTG